LAAVTVVYPCIDRDGFAMHTQISTMPDGGPAERATRTSGGTVRCAGATCLLARRYSMLLMRRSRFFHCGTQLQISLALVTIDRAKRRPGQVPPCTGQISIRLLAAATEVCSTLSREGHSIDFTT
jgi:hypothetical protein